MQLNSTAIRWLKIGALAVVGILILAMIYLVGSIFYFSAIDQKRPADAAIILGAAAWYKRPSPVFEERIQHGLWLYQNGYVKKLIMTGGKPLSAPYSEAYVARRFALKNHIPIDDILIEEVSRNTRENLENAKQLMKIHGLKSAIIVSDPFHMKRAMSIAEDLEVEAYSSPTPTTRYAGFFQSLRFLFQETGRLIGYYILGLP